eukprot:7471-Rhodomonas_salina.2
MLRKGKIIATVWLVAELSTTTVPGHVFDAAASATVNEGVHFVFAIIFGSSSCFLPREGWVASETRPVCERLNPVCLLALVLFRLLKFYACTCLVGASLAQTFLELLLPVAAAPYVLNTLTSSDRWRLIHYVWALPLLFVPASMDDGDEDGLLRGAVWSCAFFIHWILCTARDSVGGCVRPPGDCADMFYLKM